jgi:uncharacterized protein YqhQ
MGVKIPPFPKRSEVGLSSRIGARIILTVLTSLILIRVIYPVPNFWRILIAVTIAMPIVWGMSQGIIRGLLITCGAQKLRASRFRVR